MTDNQNAPGKPGVASTWAPSAKDGVGTALNPDCLLWFTIHSGIVTEIFYPSIDRGAIRDFGLLIADGHEFFSEEKADTDQAIEPLASGVPGWRLTNTCRSGRYRIVKTVIADPQEPTLLVKVKFEALQGALADYKIYALIAPHLGDEGEDNTAYVIDQEGQPLLAATDTNTALAVASSSPFTARSCGYVGVSDGWQDVHKNFRLTNQYATAEDGNVALTGEIDPASCDGEFVIVLGFGANIGEATGRALVGVREDFDEAVKTYIETWQEFQSRLIHLGGHEFTDFARMSAAVLKSHDAKLHPGGLVASLSTPWGFARGDSTKGGYHVIWPRDQVEAALALLAAGDTQVPRQSLQFLEHTQAVDGHWSQNMWVTGEAYWDGLQLDETALPILLADALRRENALGGLDPYPMVRRAADFLMSSGPWSPMDRWEENSGYSPFTLATMVAALLAAADFADQSGEADTAGRMREKADSWNSRIEEWTYASGTPLAREHGVDGYYVRIAPPDVQEQGGPAQAKIVLKNQEGAAEYPAWQIVSPDALALVRFGLRRADDPRILNTIKVIDATLRAETSTGPIWHRYTHDGYGERSDGSPFEGAGIGRGWPILAGERAHYEIARGNRDEAQRLLEAIKRQSSGGGMLPEQIWDCDDIPEHDLFNGRPSGSAMPLAWAHAETLKLMRSLKDGKVWDMPPQTTERYLAQHAP